MINSVLDTVMARIKSLLVNVQDSILNDPLFISVAENGEAMDVSSLPVAGLAFGSETTTRTTNKVMHTLPWEVFVVFDVPATQNKTPREWGAHILGELKKAVLNDPTLIVGQPSGIAVDSRYTGGGSEITGIGQEEPPGTWGFIAEFETDYRHRDTDPAVAL